MPSVNIGSIMKKVEAFANSSEGKARMAECVKKYREKGVKKTAANDVVVSSASMNEAAEKLISALWKAAKSCDLPDSVMHHFESLTYGKPIVFSDGSTEVTVFFLDDLHRDSLYPEGYDGTDNIIARFNNGIHAKNYVYGDWDGHHTRSRKDRQGLYFIDQAIRDFNGNYGAEFNVTAVAGSDYT